MNLKAYLHLFLIIVGMNIFAHAAGTKSTLASSSAIDMLLIQSDIVVFVEVQSIDSIGKPTFDIFRYGRLVTLKPSVVYASNSKKMPSEIYLFQKGAVQGSGETCFDVGEEYIVFLKASPPPDPVSDDIETAPALPQGPYYSVLKRRNSVVSKRDKDAFSKLDEYLRAEKNPSKPVPVNTTNSAIETEAATSMPKLELPEHISQLLEMRHSESYAAAEEILEKVFKMEDRSKQETYLVKIAERDIDQSLKKENLSKYKAECLKKTTAIRLLGKTPGTNHVDVLIQQLRFTDPHPNNSTYPAIDALVDKGEKATSILWKRIENTTIDDMNNVIIACHAGAALKEILGSSAFYQSLEKRRHKMHKQIYQALLARSGGLYNSY